MAVRGIRAGKADYGCRLFAERSIDNVVVSTRFIYRDLLKQIVAFFSCAKLGAVDPRTTLEIVAFIEAAFKKLNNDGISEKLIV